MKRNTTRALAVQDRESLTVTEVSGQCHVEVGDQLVPQVGSTFTPSERKAHPESDGGEWVSVSKVRDGEYAGSCKVRVGDGLTIDALSQKSYIKAR